MHRSLKYIAFTGTSVVFCAFMYRTHRDNKFGKLYAAEDGLSAEVLRYCPTHERRDWNKNWDFREPNPRSSEFSSVPSLSVYNGESNQSSRKRNATRHLLFIRHGEYDNAEDEKKVLTSRGRQQAKETAMRLSTLHSNGMKIDKIVISTMIRARETGEIIMERLKGVPFEYCDFLREGAPCVPEPTSSNWKAKSVVIFQESARIEAAFRRYVHRAEPEQQKDSVEVYVCHANVIRYFICRALQFPIEGWLRMNISHCGITWLAIKPDGRVSLRSMGDTGHLPPNLINLR